MSRFSKHRQAAAICSVTLIAAAIGFGGCASGGGQAGPPRKDGPPAGGPAGHHDRRSDSRVLAVHMASNQPSQVIPVIRRDSRDVLRLSFDVAGDRREFYTAHFHPATRDWELSTVSEEGILPPPDDITEYEASTDLDFPYVQYTYEFPNSRVDFYRSGNFVLQVLDDRGGVVLEKQFYVSDDVVDLRIDAKSTSLITDRPDELIPEARVRIPTDPWFSPAACSVRFFKNGWTDEYFHVDMSRPEGDDYVFDAPSVFRLTIPVYSTDLTGNAGIRRRDAITIPETVSLLPDDMRFWGDDYRFSSPLPRRATPHDALTRYVMAEFAVQNGPRNDPPYLVGTFSDWEVAPTNRLSWNPEAGAYEIRLPLREEQFFYTYVWSDPNNVRPQSKFEGPGEVVFTGVVYANDRRYPTERILAVFSQTLPDEK
ncbi:MAG: DUF5103 domain-containing protein [Candidatus Eisenbacteria bacterium]